MKKTAAAAGNTLPDWSGFVGSKVKADVLRYLQDAGWAVLKQTFYNHCKSGKLQKNRKGVYSMRGVKKYAEENLLHTATGETVVDSDTNLLREKTEKEIKRIDTTTRHEQFKLDVAIGKYMLRSDVEAELASRAVVLDNGLEYMFQAQVADMIAIVGGDQLRAAELLEFLITAKNQQMNEYANMGEFKISLNIEE